MYQPNSIKTLRQLKKTFQPEQIDTRNKNEDSSRGQNYDEEAENSGLLSPRA